MAQEKEKEEEEEEQRAVATAVSVVAVDGVDGVRRGWGGEGCGCVCVCVCGIQWPTSITADMTSAGIYEKLNVSISGIRRLVRHELNHWQKSKESLGWVVGGRGWGVGFFCCCCSRKNR